MYIEDIVTLIGYAVSAIMADLGMIGSVTSCVQEGYPVVGVIMMLPFVFLNALVVFLAHEVFTD